MKNYGESVEIIANQRVQRSMAVKEMLHCIQNDKTTFSLTYHILLTTNN